MIACDRANSKRKKERAKFLSEMVCISLQDKEAHLDIIMDRMRQDAAEKALKDSLTRALEMLEKIRLAYVYFLVMQLV